ncbi:2,3-dihydro-2,3-dihydroxybenzoate dehydrogenase [Vibrio xiamenensis]|uniref:2,3-dihydro-2,3-dihydroxybenzoate dehydrogenase n=1 Tax=Vibrio xiamenensis TaxID=861298 RepID=A0A1G8H7K5_9VIBR|nr:2,3-dihydro-2,3-dihydroxybenzoate dehydrogenase [Vibrio xiamenensis]SDI02612.1 2,3-dihydro-2,3-dihydroxybenzoate dehydrogenase [Vibrio xiamenensis]
MQFNHQRVLLIGAATGIGFSVLEHLVKSGAQVVAADRQLELLLENSETLRQQFPQQMTCQYLDLAEHHTLISQVEDWIQQYGDFDHLVCCAGVLPVGSLHKMPLEQVKQAFDINTFGVLAAMQAVTSGMQQRRRGSMVVIGSNAANTPRNAIGAYGASKAALHMMVKCMGIELAPFGIRCNIVSPGSTRTAMQRQLWTDSYGEAEVIAGDASQFRLGIPLQKIAEPSDIAQTVLFLLSDAANHITMHDLRVDGGATLDN